MILTARSRPVVRLVASHTSPKPPLPTGRIRSKSGTSGAGAVRFHRASRRLVRSPLHRSYLEHIVSSESRTVSERCTAGRRHAVRKPP